jgi:hypothetical protein
VRFAVIEDLRLLLGLLVVVAVAVIEAVVV